MCHLADGKSACSRADVLAYDRTRSATAGMIGDHARDKAEPRAGQAKHYGDKDIGGGPAPFAVACKIERLESERRDRSIAAAKPDHHERAEVRRHGKAALRGCKRTKESDQERSGDVD